MIDGCFAFVRGVGPARERELRAHGIRSWGEFPTEGVVLSAALDARLREGIQRASELVTQQRFDEMSLLLPARDRWRLFPHLAERVCYLDIETTADGRVTVIGLYDPQGGPRLYVRGHNLHAFVEEPMPAAIATFNGAAFDVPILERTFPGWRPPRVHLDLRTIFKQLNERGGLKAIEDRLGLGRPDHLKGVGGLDAIWLWDAFRQRRDVGALRRLLEYNLYDVVQLRSLAEIACGRLAERDGRTWSPQHPFVRGEVLLDISRAVEAIAVHAPRIEPDMVHDPERRILRAAQT